MIGLITRMQLDNEKFMREEYAKAEWFPYFTWKPVRLGTQQHHRLSRIRPTGPWRCMCTIEVAVTTNRLYFRDPLTSYAEHDQTQRIDAALLAFITGMIVWILLV